MSYAMASLLRILRQSAKGKNPTNHKCNQQSRGKKVFGYASRPPIMSEHRFYWGLRYHLANVGVFCFFFCFVLSVDTHISFSHPPWQAASCVRVSILSVKHFSSINHLITHSSISKMRMTQWITLESTTVVELARAEGVPATGLATVAYNKNIIVPLRHFTVSPPPHPSPLSLFAGASLGASVMRWGCTLCRSL